MPSFHVMFIPIFLAILGAVIWFVRLEGRVNLLERLLSQHIMAMEHTLTRLSHKLDQMDDKLDTIRINCAAHYPTGARRITTGESDTY